MGGSGGSRSGLLQAVRPEEQQDVAASPRRRVVLPAAGALLAGAVVCDFVLTLSTWTGGARTMGLPAWPVLVTWGGQLVGIALVLLVLVALTALLGRVWAALATVLAVALPLAAVNHTKLVLRGEPVYPSDVGFLSQPGFLGSMVGPGRLALLGLLVVVPVAVCFLVGRVLARRHPRPHRRVDPQGWRRHVLTRGVVLGSCLLLLQPATQFNEPGNPWRGAYDRSGVVWRSWSQTENYLFNGFVAGFLYNTHVTAMEPPPGYGPEAMEEVARRYQRAADRINRGRTPGTLADVNVVLVLGESFSDPLRLSGMSVATDPIARTRATMATTASGSLLSEGYGGGTATMEFEVLTGLPLRNFEPQVTSPYQMVVPDLPSFPSAVGALAADGHRTIAIHPYQTQMYRREEVYRAFGFDQFVHDTTMAEQTRLERSPYLSDSTAYDEVLAREAASPEPLLAHVVTMQNHMPWADWYDDPVPVAGPDDPDVRAEVGTYLRGLSYSDAALADFLRALRRSPERTVVLFYGDHLPGLYDDVLPSDPARTRWETPFFVWDSRGNLARPQPLTSAGNLLPLLYDVVGEPVPPYYALLERLRRHLPAVTRRYLVTADGTEVADEASLSPRVQGLLDDLRLVQYDFSLGHRYALDAMWPQG
ncbi:LTA synthase family protein [Nocardioides taihuensis]|uniref:LTA synthase family protein n=1 Tax=Nocardioides taihuensis TaxID=1835606 RepID=A0ABW0BIB7_9ACTN